MLHIYLIKLEVGAVLCFTNVLAPITCRAGRGPFGVLHQPPLQAFYLSEHAALESWAYRYTMQAPKLRGARILTSVMLGYVRSKWVC